MVFVPPELEKPLAVPLSNEAVQEKDVPLIPLVLLRPISVFWPLQIAWLPGLAITLGLGFTVTSVDPFTDWFPSVTVTV